MNRKPTETTEAIGEPALGMQGEGTLADKRPAPGGAMWLQILGQTPDGQPFELALSVPNVVADSLQNGTRFRVTLETIED